MSDDDLVRRGDVRRAFAAFCASAGDDFNATLDGVAAADRAAALRALCPEPPTDDAEFDRYLEVFARAIRECVPATQGEGRTCDCVRYIGAHLRRLRDDVREQAERARRAEAAVAASRARRFPVQGGS